MRNPSSGNGDGKAKVRSTSATVEACNDVSVVFVFSSCSLPCGDGVAADNEEEEEAVKACRLRPTEVCMEDTVGEREND